MYTKIKFASDLKRRILKKQDIVKIGIWVYQIYLEWHDINDVSFLNLLIHLNTMELGPEFAFTYEELNQIADDLIAGKEVKL